MGEIVALAELSEVSAKSRKASRKLVLTNGCFDLLHVGHVRYLQAARQLGGLLVVGLNGDGSVRALKGANRPINKEADRAEVLAALACVDYVTIFSEKRATRLIEIAQPVIYAKGGDYRPETLDVEERTALEQVHAQVVILQLQKGYSTTNLIGKFSQATDTAASECC